MKYLPLILVIAAFSLNSCEKERGPQYVNIDGHAYEVDPVQPSTFMDGQSYPFASGDCWVLEGGPYNPAYPQAYTFSGQALYRVSAKYDMVVYGVNNNYYDSVNDTQSMELFVTKEQRDWMINMTGPQNFSFDSGGDVPGFVYVLTPNGVIGYLGFIALGN